MTEHPYLRLVRPDDPPPKRRRARPPAPVSPNPVAAQKQSQELVQELGRLINILGVEGAVAAMRAALRPGWDDAMRAIAEHGPRAKSVLRQELHRLEQEICVLNRKLSMEPQDPLS
jgi:hypothetical protein